MPCTKTTVWPYDTMDYHVCQGTLKSLAPQIICSTCYSSNIDMSCHGHYWMTYTDWQVLHMYIISTIEFVQTYIATYIIASFNLLNTLCSYNVQLANSYISMLCCSEIVVDPSCEELKICDGKAHIISNKPQLNTINIEGN